MLLRGGASVLALVSAGQAFADPQTSPAAPAPAAASPQEGAASGDIVVTASRREETVSKLPFNISAYGAQQLEKANINSVAALTQQVPNFVIEDRGSRSIASAIPVIRGLNASQPAVNSARYFQSPVGFYYGNAPVTGSLPLFDLERVEVLRGPQGTLYGAGSLSGAVRFVPAAPRLDSVSGFVTASGTAVNHSKDVGYSIGGALNLPLGSTLALRVSGKYDYTPGFIDQFDILKRTNNDYAAGIPVLADPTDVAGSKAVYFNKRDVNYSRTTSARAALLWKPTPEFSATASYTYSRIKGVGGPLDNAGYAGGPSPMDPRVQLTPTGPYQRSSPMLEPFERTSQLAALDLSYDVGFATLSSTLAYGKTEGTGINDSTNTLLGSPYAFYYTGVPANPRTVLPTANIDRERSYTEEVRLVSNPGGRFDYIIGAFFQQQTRRIILQVYDPGADVQSAAANGGSTVPIGQGGTYVPLLPGTQLAYNQDTTQKFRDYSVYGELTFHATDAWQITGGARVFHQTFDSRLLAQSSFYSFYPISQTNDFKKTSQIFKVNTSYKVAPNAQIYGTWSQGFRRGGANAFPTAGPVQEPAQLLTYAPDKTNNFEVGIKGSVAGIRYSFDAFYIKWDKPQIDLLTPYVLTAVVINGSKATSKGLEFEASGQLPLDGLSFSLGAAWAKARLSQDFVLPSGDGAGGIVPNALNGRKGDRLPGAPDYSGSATLNYEARYGTDLRVTYSGGVDYRSSTVNQLANLSPVSPTRSAPGYALLRASIGFDWQQWQVQLVGTNLADKRAVISPNVRTLSSYQILGDWANTYAIVRPREFSLQVTRKF
ncbi:TonB-dependent receptor [Sphingomonas sp. TX0543]|uniref:TonB-dependent receptor n=1 Tax=Sphingomonas sp. TX0543 TaxID=3399682 RepID=UPI003AFAC09A